MKFAVDRVLAGERLKTVARDTGLDRNTFRKYFRTWNAKGEDLSSYKPHYANHAMIFTPEEKKQLADYLLNCSNICLGLTRKQVKELAFEYAVKIEKTLTKQQIENRILGDEWYITS